MSGGTLNTQSTLQCPHGGSVQITSANVRAKVDSASMALQSDTFIVSGCPFQIPAVPPIPSPCLQVIWAAPAMRVKVGGTPALTRLSTGMCLSAAGIPQGPVIIANTQAKAKNQ